MSQPPLTLRDVVNDVEREQAYAALREYYSQIYTGCFNLGNFISRHEAVELRPIEREMQAQLSKLFAHVSFIYDRALRKQAEEEARNRAEWTGD
jgi:hypothetical protein